MSKFRVPIYDLGNAESTDPRPRRKTNEPSKPDRDKTIKRWAIEDHQESKRLGGRV